MGIREQLNERPGTAFALSGGMLVLAVAALGVQLWGMGAATHPAARVFLSTDDGQTYFVHGSEQFPPFTLDGKEAVIAHVFECDGKRFVGYLQKYTPQGKAEMAKLQQSMGARAVNAAAPFGIDERQTLYKKPGDKEWKPATDPAGGAATLVRCPGGGGVPMRVAP